MRAFVAILVCAAVVAGGTTLAIASGGGFTRGNPSHHQYKPKPPCKPHDGKPWKGHFQGRGHCPKPKPRWR